MKPNAVSTIHFESHDEPEKRLSLYARVSHCVLITGERGTGKTTTAKRLHSSGPRARHQFVNLNCASLSENLLESELFGYERGAFTGATSSRAGLFEIAAGGTLFLDEIGELPLGLQAKLLKAVEEKRIRRVGSNLERPVDVRIIAATSRNLERMIDAGTFRADLFDRLNILRLEVKPLRRQPAVIIPLLTGELTRERAALGTLRPFSFAPDAESLLLGHSWRGNYREAINLAVRLAVDLGDHEVITASDLLAFLDSEKRGRSALAADADDRNTSRVTVTFDPEEDDLDSIYLKAAGSVIRHVLASNGNSFRQAARTMGATHTTLSRIMQKYQARSAAPAAPPPAAAAAAAAAPTAAAAGNAAPDHNHHWQAAA